MFQASEKIGSDLIDSLTKSTKKGFTDSINDEDRKIDFWDTE